MLLLIDPESAQKELCPLAFWLLPEILVHGKIEAIISYQHQSGEKKPILYKDTARTVAPGARSKESVLFHSSGEVLYVAVNRDELLLPEYCVAAIVWSAGGNWLDKPPVRYPIVESLPEVTLDERYPEDRHVTEFGRIVR